MVLVVAKLGEKRNRAFVRRRANLNLGMDPGQI
jgi:hypothetical protein